MKTKTLSLSFGLMLAFLLSITFMLAGCSKTLNFNQQLEAAAHSYFDARNSYTNFADITYSSDETSVDKGKDTLTYTPTGGEQQSLNYETNNTATTQTKLYVKRIGEELALKLEQKVTTTSKDKDFNEITQQVEDTTYTCVTETTYTMAPKTEEDETVSYYIVGSFKVTEDGEVVYSDSQYYKFADKAAYRQIITNYLLKSDDDINYCAPISKNISSVFNNIFEVRAYAGFMGGTEKIKEDKNSASYSGKVENFGVYNNKISAMSFGLDLKIKKNKLESIKTSTTYNYDDVENANTNLYSITDGANVEIVIDIEGADSQSSDFSLDMFEAFPRVYVELGL